MKKYKTQLRPKIGTKVRLTKPLPAPKRKKNSKALKALKQATKAIGTKVRKKIRAVKKSAAIKKRAAVKKCARRNPDTAQQAAKVYQMFHGRAVDGFTEIVQAHGLPANVVEQLKALVPPEDYAKLGDVVSLLTREGRILFQEGERPILATNPEANRLYLISGNQNIDAMLGQLKAKSDKGLIDLGECLEIEYFTRKKFDQFKPVIYYHEFGEESGKRPRLMYDRKRKQLHLVAGNYKIKNVGIVD